MPKSKTPKSKKPSKDQILNAAEDVFASKGYGGARTAEIAEKAGVNKALIHYYFTNKEHLYHAVMDRLLFDFIKIAQDVLKLGLKERKLVEGLFDAFFDFAAKHTHFARLTTVESAGEQARYLDNMLQNFFGPLFERGVDFIKSQQSKGKINKGVDPEHFIISTYLVLLGYFNDRRFISTILKKDACSKEVLKTRKKHFKNMMLGQLYHK